MAHTRISSDYICMKKLILLILSFILLLFSFVLIFFFIKYISNVVHYTHIKAEFTELAPFSKNMPVYFKGFKIGKVTKILPKDDFTATQMSVTLFPENVKFPKNISLKVKSYKKNMTYAEIELPELASEKTLKDGDTIKGETNMTFESIMQKQAESGSFDLIIGTLGEIMVNLNNTIKETEGLVKDIRVTFKNNENFISVSTRNLSEATGNLTKTSVTLSSTVDQKTLDRTMKNIEETSNNMRNITRNIDCATRNLSDTMENVNGISENVNGITNSVNCTMKNRFGGFRLIFGKADQNCKCKKTQKPCLRPSYTTP